MKKVLIVSHNIALYRKSVFEMLMVEQDVDYYIAASCDQVSDIENVDSKFFESSKFIRLENIWFKKILLWQKNLGSEIFSKKYDAIIFLGDPHFLGCWLYGALLKFSKIKVYFWTHGFIRDLNWKDKLKESAFFKLPYGFVLYGEQAKNRLVKKGFDSERLFPIYNSLDYKSQKYLREKIDVEQIRLTKSRLFGNYNLPTLMFVGRLTPQKKLNILIEIVNKLHLKGFKCNLLFIGDGKERTYLEGVVHELGLKDYVHFYGKTYDEAELAELIMLSDVCVSPGEVGLTAMHVMSYGVPVITHDSYIHQMPEYEAVIDGVTGFLYRYGDYDNLFDKIVKFFDLKATVDFKNNCIEMIENKYTPSVQVKRINDAIKYG